MLLARRLCEALDPGLDAPDLPLEQPLVVERVRQQRSALDGAEERDRERAGVALPELAELALGPLENRTQGSRGVGAKLTVLLVELVRKAAERTAMRDDLRPVARPRLRQCLQPGARCGCGRRRPP